MYFNQLKRNCNLCLSKELNLDASLFLLFGRLSLSYNRGEALACR